MMTMMVVAMPVARTRMPVMAMPMMMAPVMAMMTTILHVGRKAGGILHRAGNARIDQRRRLSLLAGRSHEQQSADGEKAQNLRKVHF
jgi:hypothetical protein